MALPLAGAWNYVLFISSFHFKLFNIMLNDSRCFHLYKCNYLKSLEHCLRFSSAFTSLHKMGKRNIQMPVSWIERFFLFGRLGEGKDESPKLCSYYSTVVLRFIATIETFQLFLATENYSKIDLKKVRKKTTNVLLFLTFTS